MLIEFFVSLPVFVSMGFACVENILYVFSGGFGTGIARAVLVVPGHFLFAVIMGYFFFRARFTPVRRGHLLWMAFLCPVLAHGLYDTLCFTMEMYGEMSGLSYVLSVLFIAFNVKLWQIGLKAIRTHCHTCGAKIPQRKINCSYCEHLVKFP